MTADQIRHPSHYTASAAGFKVECIALTRSMGFAPGNAVKYVWRHRDKGTAALDLGKTEQYLEWCVEHQLPAPLGGQPDPPRELRPPNPRRV